MRVLLHLVVHFSEVLPEISGVLLEVLFQKIDECSGTSYVFFKYVDFLFLSYNSYFLYYFLKLIDFFF